MKDLTDIPLKELELMLQGCKILLTKTTDKKIAARLRNDRSRLTKEISKRKKRKNPQ